MTTRDRKGKFCLRFVYCITPCVVLSIVAPARALDPVNLLDPSRYGAGTILVALQELEGYRLDTILDKVLPLLGHEDKDVAIMAAWLLRKKNRSAHGAQAAQEILLNAERSLKSRVAAALSLGQLKEPASMDPLRRSLQHDSSCEIRAASVKAIGQLYRSGMADILAHSLSSDPCLEVRSQAATALGGLPDTESAHLLPGLDDEVISVRVNVAWALGRKGYKDPKTLARLVSSLQNDAHCRVQAAVIWALTQSFDDSVVAPIQEARWSDCRVTSQSAIWALKKLSL